MIIPCTSCSWDNTTEELFFNTLACPLFLYCLIQNKKITTANLPMPNGLWLNNLLFLENSVNDFAFIFQCKSTCWRKHTSGIKFDSWASNSFHLYHIYLIVMPGKSRCIVFQLGDINFIREEVLFTFANIYLCFLANETLSRKRHLHVPWELFKTPFQRLFLWLHTSFPQW